MLGNFALNKPHVATTSGYKDIRQKPFHINSEPTVEIFVIVIPKEDLAGTSPAKSSFFCRTKRRRGGFMPAKQSIGMTTTKILRPVFAAAHLV